MTGLPPGVGSALAGFVGASVARSVDCAVAVGVGVGVAVGVATGDGETTAAVGIGGNEIGAGVAAPSDGGPEVAPAGVPEADGPTVTQPATRKTAVETASNALFTVSLLPATIVRNRRAESSVDSRDRSPLGVGRGEVAVKVDQPANHVRPAIRPFDPETDRLPDAAHCSVRPRCARRPAAARLRAVVQVERGLHRSGVAILVELEKLGTSTCVLQVAIDADQRVGSGKRLDALS